MFGNIPDTETLRDLYREGKELIKMETEYLRLELVEKLTILISTLILIMVLLVVGMVAMFYLSLALASLIEPLVGSQAMSYTLIFSGELLLMLAVYLFRRPLIINPLIRFLSRLFLGRKP